MAWDVTYVLFACWNGLILWKYWPTDTTYKLLKDDSCADGKMSKLLSTTMRTISQTVGMWSSAASIMLCLNIIVLAADTETETPLVSPVIMEIEAWGGRISRGGDALNSSGSSPDEIEELSLFGVGFLAAIPISNNLLLQIETGHETTLEQRLTAGINPDDTYADGFHAGGHLALINPDLLIGGFVDFGKTNFTAEDADQNANFWSYGAEIKVNFDPITFALQSGTIDSSAQNQEVIADAWFLRAIGQLFFNDNQTMLQGDISFVGGTQDIDDTPFDNPYELMAWGIELEHNLTTHAHGANSSIFVVYEGLRGDEASTSGRTDTITQNTIIAGIRFKLGAQNPYEREMFTAPDLPNISRWMGATPAVD